MNIRKKFNESVRNTGNRIREGLGDVLTKEIKLEKPLSIIGALGGTMFWGGAICNELYKTGVIDAISSDNISDRIAGIGMNTALSIVYLTALPIWILGGAFVGNYVGRQLDKI